MLTLLLMVAVSATPEAKEVTLAVPGLSFVGVSEKQGDVYVDYFAQQVTRRGVHVITRTDITAALGLERQKQLLGCTDEKSCIAELAGGLGVSALVVGSLAVTEGGGFVLNLKVTSASGSGRPIAVFSERVRSEEALYTLLEKSALELSDQLKPKPAASGARSLAWVPMTVGLLAVGAGGVLFGVAKGTEGEVARGAPDITSLDVARARLQSALGLQTAAFISFGVGLAALLVAGGLALFGDAPGAPSVSVLVGPSGAALSLAWGLP